jgi:hypothetical protein
VVLAAPPVLGLIRAFKGNEWRIKNLAKRGFVYVGPVSAETHDVAIAQALKNPEV